MTRIVSVTAPDANWHQMSTVLPTPPAGTLAPDRGCFMAFRTSDANAGSVSINIGTTNYTTDGSVQVSKGDPSFVITSPSNSVNFGDFWIKASAVGAIYEILIHSH
jgi:hypothetical protein